jgi:predicted nucleotidyltransferase
MSILEQTCELQPELSRILERHGVRLAYLFGSQAAGRARADSDVDVAVLLRPDLSDDARFETRLALIGELGQLLRTDNVDLVVLNEAPPLLAYEVLHKGRVLYCADERERIEFQVRTLREYEDTEPLRRALDSALVERIRTGRFGKPVLGRR